MSHETEAYVKGQLYNIPIDRLLADPEQPRKHLDPQALEELTQSILRYGLLQPVLFRRDSNVRLFVVAGERRVEAARRAGMKTIPAVYVEGKPAELSLIENLVRQNLTAVEEAEALQRLIEDLGYTQDELASIFSRSKSTISETLSLNRLHRPVRDECRNDPTIPKRELIVIARSKQQRSMVSLFRKYRERQLARERPKRRKPRLQETRHQEIAYLEAVWGKIAAIDLAGFSPEEEKSLVKILEALKGAIEEKLAGLTAAAVPAADSGGHSSPERPYGSDSGRNGGSIY